MAKWNPVHCLLDTISATVTQLQGTARGVGLLWQSGQREEHDILQSLMIWRLTAISYQQLITEKVKGAESAALLFILQRDVLKRVFKNEMQKYLSYKMLVFFTWNAFISNCSYFLSISASRGMGTRSHPDRTLSLATALVSCVNLEMPFNFSKLFCFLKNQ